MEWENRLKDSRARALIAARIFRLANGLAGDVSPVGEGVSELRSHYGPGYRVYFQQCGLQLVVLLCGGDKSRQSRDIGLAKYPGPSLESIMNEPLFDYDPATALRDPQAIALFMADAFETGRCRLYRQSPGRGGAGQGHDRTGP